MLFTVSILSALTFGLHFVQLSPFLFLHSLHDLQGKLRLLFEEILDDIGVKICFHGDMSMADNKVITVITDTNGSRRCNLCGLLPREYRFRAEYAYQDLSLIAIENIQAAILHCGLNSFNNLYEVAVRNAIGSDRWNTPSELSDARKAKIKEFQQKFLDHGFRVGFPNPLGGTSTTGNVVRDILNFSGQFQYVNAIYCN